MGWDKVGVVGGRDGGTWWQTFTTRAVGQGQMLIPVRAPYPFRITGIRYRAGTADGGGTPTAELRKNGTGSGQTVTGTSGSISTTPTEVTGTWDIALGDEIYVWQTAIGTGTIGQGLAVYWRGIRL
ncbi:hypothetical protein ACTD5D_31850 [Nocardia takedensis]|uniref:hypothetical protein n=1 Tax=Nocardia takedensis TaxID=259390 RepID=UPI003F777E51